MSNKSSSNRLEVVINISDVLALIPEFNGEQGEVPFMYFREACRNALAILGPRNETLLLIFLKTKLKDDAYMRFALRLSTYDKLSQFLCDAKHTYAPKCDEPSFWQIRMFEMRQKTESSLPKYAARFQELLSCATIAARHEEMMQAFMAIQENKEKQRRMAIEQSKKKQLESAKSVGDKVVPKRRLNLEEVMEIIAASAPYDDDNPKIETPVTPQPRRAAEKTLSIKDADYPQLEYPKVPTTRPYKIDAKDSKKEYKRDAVDDFKWQYKKDADDLKYELKPKTVTGKTS